MCTVPCEKRVKVHLCVSEEILVLLKDVIVLPAARVVLVASVLHKCLHSFFISCH